MARVGHALSGAVNKAFAEHTVLRDSEAELYSELTILMWAGDPVDRVTSDELL